MSRSVRISEEDLRPVFGVAAEVMARHPSDYVEHQRTALANIRRALARLDRIPKSKPERGSARVEARRARRLGEVPRAEVLETRAALEAALFGRSRKPSKEEKRKRRANCRDVVFERADDRCEGPTDSNPSHRTRCVNPAADFAHIFGRGAGRWPESARSCVALCRTCHETCGHNTPTGTAWWKYWAWWFQAQCYMREAKEATKRAAFVETRASLPTAPRSAPVALKSALE